MMMNTNIQDRGSYVYLIVCQEDRPKTDPFLEQLYADGCRLLIRSGNAAITAEDYAHLQYASVCVMFLSNTAIRTLPIDSFLTAAENSRIRWITVYLEECRLPEGLRLMQGNIQAVQPGRKDIVEKLRRSLPDDVFESGRNPVLYERQEAARGRRSERLAVVFLMVCMISAVVVSVILLMTLRSRRQVTESVSDKPASSVGEASDAALSVEEVFDAASSVGEASDAASSVGEVSDAASSAGEAPDAASAPSSREPVISTEAGQAYADIMEKYADAYETIDDAKAEADLYHQVDYNELYSTFPDEVNEVGGFQDTEGLRFAILDAGDETDAGLAILGQIDESRVDSIDLLLYSGGEIHQYGEELGLGVNYAALCHCVICDESTILTRVYETGYSYSESETGVYSVKQGTLTKKDNLVFKSGAYYQGADITNSDILGTEYEKYRITRDTYNSELKKYIPLNLRTYALSPENIRAVREGDLESLTDEAVYSQYGETWLQAG